MEQEKRNRLSSFVLWGIAVLVVLIIIVGVVATSGDGLERIYFFEEETVPEDAVIVHLTEENYEKFPVLRDIPDPVDVDTSLFSFLFGVSPGCIDAETRNLLWNSNPGVYVEHEGELYSTSMMVS